MPTLLEVVEPHTAGDPMGEAKWLNCRLRDIQAQLVNLGHAVSGPVISRLLKAAGYRLRLNVKAHEGPPNAERDQQFVHIREQREAHREAGQPTISVDTKKKELVGNFKNAGRIWGREAEVVNVHDFPSEAIGRAVPYGIYDLQHNRGPVYVGQSADRPTFAVDNLLSWCQTELPQRFPGATHLFIEADGGGSNASRSRVMNYPAASGEVSDKEKVLFLRGKPRGMYPTTIQAPDPRKTGRWAGVDSHRLSLSTWHLQVEPD